MRGRWMTAVLALALSAGWVVAMMRLGEEPWREGVFHPLDSVVFSSVRYDGKPEALTMVFCHGGAYLYRNVPRWVYRGFLATDCKGAYYHAHIKGKYACVRLDPGTDKSP